MRIVSIAMLAILAGAAAGAAGQSSPQTGAPAQLAGVNVTAQRFELPHYYVPPELVHEISGAYQMSNNETARISDRRSKLYVEFDNRMTELRPIGENLYSSANNNMVLQWTPELVGGAVRLLYVPQLNMAQGNPAPVVLYAARER